MLGLSSLVLSTTALPFSTEIAAPTSLSSFVYPPMQPSYYTLRRLTASAGMLIDKGHRSQNAFRDICTGDILTGPVMMMTDLTPSISWYGLPLVRTLDIVKPPKTKGRQVVCIVKLNFPNIRRNGECQRCQTPHALGIDNSQVFQERVVCRELRTILISATA